MDIQRDQILSLCDAEQVCSVLESTPGSVEIRLGRRQGRKIQMLCPFPDHDDHKFGNCSLDTEKKMFYCFACARGGTIFDLVMLHHGWSLSDKRKSIEAIKEVAEISGCGELVSEEKKKQRVYYPPSLTEKQLRFLGLSDEYLTVEDPQTKKERTVNPLNDLRKNDPEGYCDLILRKAKERDAEYTRRLNDELAFVSRGNPVSGPDFQLWVSNITQAIQEAREIAEIILKYLIRRSAHGKDKGDYHKDDVPE